MLDSIPVIDVSSSRAATSIDRAFREVGFFVAVGHGVPRQVVDGAQNAARRFFDLPLEKKLEARRPGNPYGFEPIAHEALGRNFGNGADGDADPKQTFNLGPPMRGLDSGFGAHQRVWPTEPYELRPSLLNLYAEMESLSSHMLDLIAQALERPIGFFAPYTDLHLSALRMLDYPASPPGATQLRAGAHTDHGTLTLLRPDPDVGGLEVHDGDRSWVTVPIVDDSFVVNVGDLMHRWSNGRWRSPLHRVAGDPGGRRRNSIAFFHNPNWEAVIEPILLDAEERARFQPMQAGPWLASKVARARER